MNIHSPDKSFMYECFSFVVFPVGDVDPSHNSSIIMLNVGIIVPLSKDLMDWVSRRLCYEVGDADRSVSWTSVYSFIRMTCPGGDGACTHVNSRKRPSSAEIRTCNLT